MTEHVEHGGSVTERFTNCHGSVRMSRNRPNRNTLPAEEGTDAHALAEVCLRNGQDAEEWVGRIPDAWHRKDRLRPAEPVTAEMADAVQVYLDECRQVPTPPGRVLIEAGVDLAPLNPPAPMRGTADYLGYVPETETLRVKDLKFGRRKNVLAEGNLQLMYYALGAMLLIPRTWGIVRHIEASIVQPRRADPIRTVTLDPLALAEWSIPLFQHVAATLEPDAALTPGPWCGFCPAAGVCPAQARQAMETALQEFPDDLPPLEAEPVVEGWTGAKCPRCKGTGEVPGMESNRQCGGCGGTGDEYRETHALEVAQQSTRLIRVGNHHLTPAELSRLLSRVGEARQALTDIEEAARVEIRTNGLPGWKEVPTRPSTRWRDPVIAEGLLTMEHGLTDAEMYEPREIRSYAKVRDALHARLYAEAKAAKQKMTHDAAKREAAAALAPLAVTASSGTNIVPAADSRPALPAAVDEFDALPPLTDGTE